MQRHRLRQQWPDRTTYPCPPSATLPGLDGQRAIDAILNVDRIVHDLEPEFRRGRLRDLARLERIAGEELERLPPTPTVRTAGWSNAR